MMKKWFIKSVWILGVFVVLMSFQGKSLAHEKGLSSLIGGENSLINSVSIDVGSVLDPVTHNNGSDAASQTDNSLLAVNLHTQTLLADDDSDISACLQIGAVGADGDSCGNQVDIEIKTNPVEHEAMIATVKVDEKATAHLGETKSDAQVELELDVSLLNDNPAPIAADLCMQPLAEVHVELLGMNIHSCEGHSKDEGIENVTAAASNSLIALSVTSPVTTSSNLTDLHDEDVVNQNINDDSLIQVATDVPLFTSDAGNPVIIDVCANPLVVVHAGLLGVNGNSCNSNSNSDEGGNGASGKNEWVELVVTTPATESMNLMSIDVCVSPILSVQANPLGSTSPLCENNSGGGETPPAGNGGETPPAGSGGETPPAGSGGETPPASSGGETTPTGNGGETPPAGNGGETPPAGNGGETLPAGNGGETLPVNNGGNQLPAVTIPLLPTIDIAFPSGNGQSGSGITTAMLPNGIPLSGGSLQMVVANDAPQSISGTSPGIERLPVTGGILDARILLILAILLIVSGIWLRRHVS